MVAAVVPCSFEADFLETFLSKKTWDDEEGFAARLLAQDEEVVQMKNRIKSCGFKAMTKLARMAEDNSQSLCSFVYKGLSSEASV